MKRRIDGVLLLDKDAGMTSNAALQKAKKLYQAAKAGHTGTLDPAATGLLPICFGEATKFANFLLDTDKTYEGVIKLGIRTATGDREGDIVETRPVHTDETSLKRTLAKFSGEIEQVPPMHSALKHDGRALYRYARQGLEVDRKVRRVTIHELEAEFLPPDEIAFQARVSKGTYLRTLAEDIGRELGCCAYLFSLERTAIGHFSLAQALNLQEIENLQDSGRLAVLQPVDSLLAGTETLSCSQEECWQLQHGQTIWRSQLHPGEVYRLYDNGGGLIGIGQVNDEGKLAPKRLISAN
jgi:tRNA pseudouridine55 synthase